MKKLAKLTYILALFSFGLLFTWSIGVLVSTVFNLKVFQESTTEFALMSILPILATAAGAGIINIISNVGIIANHITGEGEVEKTRAIRIGTRVFLYGNLLLIVGLFVGNFLSDRWKERELLREIQSLSESNRSFLAKVPAGALDSVSVRYTRQILEYIDRTNAKISDPAVIFPGQYLGEKVLFSIEDRNSYRTGSDTVGHILATSEKARSRILQAFQANDPSPFAIQEENRYEVYILIGNGAAKPFLLRMNRQNRYGRLSS